MNKSDIFEEVVLGIDHRLRGYHDENSFPEVRRNDESSYGSPKKTEIVLRVYPHPIYRDDLFPSILSLVYNITRMQTGILVRANKPGVVSLDAEDRSTYQVGVENALKYVEFLVNQIRELGRVHSGVLEYLGQKGVLDDSSAYDNEKVIYSIPNSK